MDITVRHDLTYGTHRDVPVSVVAASLLANERLLIESIRLIESFTPGLKISSISIKVGELSNSSPLRELFLATLVATFQKDLVTEVPALIEELIGVHVPDNMSTLVTVTVLATAFYVINAAVERIMPGKAAARIVEEYRKKLDRMSELSGVDKETIERYTSERLEANTALSRRAIDFFMPAKLESGTEILLSSGETVTADVISEIPEALDSELSDATDSYELLGVVVDIHRYDRDETKIGWRAIIESVSPRKVRMELAATIEPEFLYGKRTVVGDVVVRESMLGNGLRGPVMYHLLRVRNES